MANRSLIVNIFKPTFIVAMLFLTACQENKAPSENDQCNCISKKNINGDRVIRFLATADPQFNYVDMNASEGAALYADRIGEIINQKVCCEDYRGVIISGDLTHNSREDEFERYHRFIKRFKQYTFDGLGNHDFARTNKEKANSPKPSIEYGLDKIIPDDDWVWNKESIDLWDEIRTRKRIPKVNSSYPNIHYSWDWEDVHFVQLNVFPGDTPVKFKPLQNPFKSLSFLKEDLKTHVGNSGRPVVLSHHYGLDEFSMGNVGGGATNAMAEFWTEAHRQAYWDVIQQYNVIAIFAGHAHLCQTVCYLPWDGSAIGEENVGQGFIPTFTSGATREGKYLDCEINENQLIVKRFDHGALDFEKTIPIKRRLKN